jgi:hypothetical protein
MIEYKFFDLGKYKNIDDASLELDKLTNYEGWLVVCSVGKRSHIILLQRMLEYPQGVQQVPIAQEQEQQLGGKREKSKRFPNAIHR